MVAVEHSDPIFIDGRLDLIDFLAQVESDEQLGTEYSFLSWSSCGVDALSAASAMPGRALITGATGLLGRAVTKAFESADWEVTGTGFSRAAPPKVLKLNVLDKSQIAHVMDEVK